MKISVILYVMFMLSGGTYLFYLMSPPMPLFEHYIKGKIEIACGPEHVDLKRKYWVDPKIDLTKPQRLHNNGMVGTLVVVHTYQPGECEQVYP